MAGKTYKKHLNKAEEWRTIWEEITLKGASQLEKGEKSTLIRVDFFIFEVPVL